MFSTNQVYQLNAIDFEYYHKFILFELKNPPF